MENKVILGRYQLPVWLAKQLVSDDDVDFIAPNGQEMVDEVEAWMDTLSGMPGKHFAIIDEKEVRVPYALFSGDKEPSVTVVAIGHLSNTDQICNAFLLDEEGAKSKILALKAHMQEGKPADFAFVSDDVWRDIVDTMPEDIAKDSIVEWVRFGNPMRQTMLAMVL